MYTFIVFFSCLCSVFDSAMADTTTIKILKDPETIVSSNNNFRLGFFSPKNSTNRYVGIWYNLQDADAMEVVWVANRDRPLIDSSGVLKMSEDGNLQVLDGKNKVFWSSNTTSQGTNTVAQLMDTGNLVLQSNATGTTIWESFKHLTDSLLPPAEYIFRQNDRKIVFYHAWKSPSDPSPGRFTSGVYRGSFIEAFTWDGDKPYWRSGPWNGNIILGDPFMSYVLNLNAFSVQNDNQESTVYLTYTKSNGSFLEHFTFSYDGVLTPKSWDYSSRKWDVLGQFPDGICMKFGYCGLYGNCNYHSSPVCSCLKGFEPKSIDEWNKGNWTSGCVRRTQLECNSTSNTDGFLKLEHMKVPYDAKQLPAQDQDDCRSKCLRNCSCLAYAFQSAFGCMIWNENLIDMRDYTNTGVDLFIRLAHSELGKTKKWKVIIPIVVVLSILTVAALVYCAWKQMTQRKGQTNIRTSEEILLHNNIEARGNQLDTHDLPMFKFEKLAAATSNFEKRNKLGEGGFGPVYKGKFENGQEIAVKRLSQTSGQGLQEFMNEVVVISKLQHRNLVKLLGCCVEGEERLLVYELMQNNSLDAILFDSHKRKILDWNKRINIIKGICRGVLYLHRDSRLKIIHRDLKASNVLLDEEWNPKISDFGMARIFWDKQDQAKTLRVAGTYGYMSPEYAMRGRFSEKSDVFSLGVLLLEIVSGQRNTDFEDFESFSLLSYAWKLWNEDNILSLVDATVLDSSFQVEILRTVQVGLLCVQEIPEDRPSIPNVISMLDNEVADLPHPLQPGFTQMRNCPRKDSQDNCSVNFVSITAISTR